MNYTKCLLLSFLIIMVIVVSGCTGNSYISSLVGNLPEVKELMAENPNAEIKAALWSSEEVEKNIDNIRNDCGMLLAIKKYWKVEITDVTANLNVTIWLDPDSNQPVCILKKVINQPETSTVKTTSTTNVQICTDSDGGIREYAFGQTSYGDHVVTDACIDSKKLKEWYCTESGEKTYKLIECPGCCKDGACKDDCEVTSTCTDSDNGINEYVYGQTSYIDHTVYDYCKDSTNLVEWYCTDTGSKTSKVIACANGCINGACISNTTSTTSIITTTSTTTTTVLQNSTWVGGPIRCRIHISSAIQAKSLALKLITDNLTRSYTKLNLWSDVNGNVGEEIFSSDEISLIQPSSDEWGNWGWITNFQGTPLYYGYHQIALPYVELVPGYYWVGPTQSDAGLNALNVGVFSDNNTNTYSDTNIYSNTSLGRRDDWDCYYKIEVEYNTFTKSTCTGFGYFIFQDQQYLDNDTYKLVFYNGNQDVTITSFAISATPGVAGTAGTGVAGTPSLTPSATQRFSIQAEDFGAIDKASGDSFNFEVTIGYTTVLDGLTKIDRATCTGMVQ